MVISSLACNHWSCVTLHVIATHLLIFTIDIKAGFKKVSPVPYISPNGYKKAFYYSARLSQCFLKGSWLHQPLTWHWCSISKQNCQEITAQWWWHTWPLAGQAPPISPLHSPWLNTGTAMPDTWKIWCNWQVCFYPEEWDPTEVEKVKSKAKKTKLTSSKLQLAKHLLI